MRASPGVRGDGSTPSSPADASAQSTAISSRRWHVADVRSASRSAVLSPLLFNLFINPIARRIATACPRLNLQLYADDMVIQPRAAKLVRGIRQHQGVASHNAVATLFNVEFVRAFPTAQHLVRGDAHALRPGQDPVGGVRQDPWAAFASKDFTRAIGSTSLCGFSPQVVEEYKYLGVTHHRQLEWYGRRVSVSYPAHPQRQPPRHPSHSSKSRPPHFPAIKAMCLGYVRARCLYAWAFWEPKPAQTRAMQAAFIQPMQKRARAALLFPSPRPAGRGALSLVRGPAHSGRSSLPSPSRAAALRVTLATPLHALWCWTEREPPPMHCQRTHQVPRHRHQLRQKPQRCLTSSYNVFARLPAR